MVAAVAAIATGAIADDNPQLWNVKINLKTFRDNYLKCDSAGSSGCVTCDLNEWGETYTWYAENETRKIEAILVNCDSCDLTFADEQNATNLAFFAWDATHQVALTEKATEGKSARWAMANGNCLTNYEGQLQVFLYGKKVNKAGVTFRFEIDDTINGRYALSAVGFGAWDLKNDRLSSASGNVLGYAPISSNRKVGYEDGVDSYTYSHFYVPATVCDAVAYCTDGLSQSTYTLPTYGTFTIKYNASKAKNYVKALPAGMVY